MVRFVVMAAGLSTRMGQNKLVMPWKDTTVLGYVLQTVQEAIALHNQRKLVVSAPSLDIEIYVVAKHSIGTYLNEDHIRMFNTNFGVWIEVPNPKPLSETIRYGLQDINSEVHYIGFMPGDQVGITARKLADCLQQLVNNHPDFLVPIVEDKAVSPVFFHKQYVPELLKLRGQQGGREVLYRYPERWWKYPVKASFARDVDTPDEYNELMGQIGILQT